MSALQLLNRELETASEETVMEVIHFAQFVKQKAGDDRFNGLLASESALCKDWDTAEEDAAWASL